MEDPATKRHHPRNYLQSLEERVAVLEAMLQDVRPEVAKDHLRTDQPEAPTIQTLSDTMSDPQPQIETTLDSNSNNQQIERISTSHVSFNRAESIEKEDVMTDLSSKIGLLSVNAPTAEPHYFGTSSALAMSRLINSALRRVNHQNPGEGDPGHMLSDFSAYDPLLGTPSPLPSAEGREVLARSYFENIHPQYPFLHEPTFRSWELLLVENSNSDDTFRLQPCIPFFVNMVCVAAL